MIKPIIVFLSIGIGLMLLASFCRWITGYYDD